MSDLKYSFGSKMNSNKIPTISFLEKSRLHSPLFCIYQELQVITFLVSVSVYSMSILQYMGYTHNIA